MKWSARSALAVCAGAVALSATACFPSPAKPKATIVDASIVEGTGGNQNLWFSIRLSASSTSIVRLPWVALDESATKPADFADSRGTVEFTPGTTQAAVHVPIATDDVDELDETLRVELSASSTADLADGVGVGTIVDDDGAPTISLDNAPSGAEADIGNWAGFPVRLSHASSQPIHVTCETVNGTAKAGSDFPVQNPCGVTVPAGAVRADLHIPRTDDNIDEDDESYGVRLLSASSGTIVDADATTTIFDNDAPPTFTVDDVDIVEGNPGDGSFARFVGHLSHPSSRTVGVRCDTRSGTATENDDFVSTGGACFSFPFERTTWEFSVAIWEDTKREDDEDFYVDILGLSADSAPAFIGDTSARAVLRNDGDSCRLFCG